ncbi:MAG: multidrug transporter [Nanoarchaeota archaeon]
MATKLWAIGLVIFTTLLTATGSVLYKLGADSIQWTFLSIITNVFLISGIIVYLVSAALLLMALKGGDVSVLYPFIATSYIWVTILSSIIFSEVINVWKWFGVLSIIIGVSCIGIGSRTWQRTSSRS